MNTSEHGAAPGPAGTPGEAQPPGRPASAIRSPRLTDEDPHIRWPEARSRAAIAGVIMVLLMMFPQIARFFIIWMPLGGAFAVYLYLQKRPGSYVPAGAGARMGAVAGMVAFTISVALLAVTFAVEHFILHHSAELVAALRNQIQQAVASNPDPQVRQMAQGLLTPDGLALIAILSLIFLFGMFVILCGLGGMLGSMFLDRRDKHG